MRGFSGMLRLFAFTLSFFVFSTLFSYSSPRSGLQIYLYDKPYHGEYLVKESSVYLEQKSLLKMLGLPSGEVFQSSRQIRQNGKTFVLLTDAATNLHSSVMMNWQTGIVDMYSPYNFPQPEVSGVPTGFGSTYYRNEIGPGPITVVPPSAYEPYKNCSPISCLPLNPLPPPVANVTPLVGNPWYNYPSYAPDPYYGASNPNLYNNYYPGYYPYSYSRVPFSTPAPIHMSGGILPEDDRFIPINSYMGPGYGFYNY